MAMKMLVFLAVAILASAITQGRFVSKCELKNKLEEAGLPIPPEAIEERLTIKDLIAKVICRVFQASKFNTGLVTTHLGHHGAEWDKEEWRHRRNRRNANPRSPNSGPDTSPYPNQALENRTRPAFTFSPKPFSSDIALKINASNGSEPGPTPHLTFGPITGTEQPDHRHTFQPGQGNTNQPSHGSEFPPGQGNTYQPSYGHFQTSQGGGPQPGQGGGSQQGQGGGSQPGQGGGSQPGQGGGSQHGQGGGSQPSQGGGSQPGQGGGSQPGQGGGAQPGQGGGSQPGQGGGSQPGQGGGSQHGQGGGSQPGQGGGSQHGQGGGSQPDLRIGKLVFGKFYGVFQLSWQACDDSFTPSPNHCEIKCSALVDDDISDDIECFKKIGNFWSPDRLCRNVRSASDFLCD